MKIVTAGFAVIGDEILSGRTRDANIHHLAMRLGEMGIDLAEVRIIRDEQAHIVEAINQMRARYDHIFTSGGIGPTHDDITADAIAAAFGVKAGEDPRAVKILTDFYPDRALTPSRLRMTRIPEGASLIRNDVSGAPGFTIGNVHVMAGVPAIMQSMLENVLSNIETGTRMDMASLDAPFGESWLAEELGQIQDRFKNVSIGSYPRQQDGKYSTQIVLRSRDGNALAQSADLVRILIAKTKERLG